MKKLFIIAMIFISMLMMSCEFEESELGIIVRYGN
jgi:hypothetical protein